MLKPRRPNNLAKLNNINRSYFQPEYRFNPAVYKGEGMNNKSIAETHPFILLRKVISISFFNVSPNLGRNNGVDETFEIKSIKQIKEDYRSDLLKYYTIFPEMDIKNFPTIESVETFIEKQINEVNIPSPETDKMFTKFLKEEILNDESFDFNESDCDTVIGPAYILLTEIFNQTYNNLKDLHAIKYYESLKGDITKFVDLR